MIGNTLAHYEITGLLGKGGMGEVYRARDLKLDRDVALKVVPSDIASDPARLERFEREAKTVAGLNNPHIVTLHSVEEDQGIHFFTMELVEGEALDRTLTSVGLPLPKVLEVGIAVADALAAAEAKGIVHRDIKPANVMVTHDGRVKVLDFGLAKLGPDDTASDTDATRAMGLTREGSVLGTVPYMSPEQLRGQDVDHRSDIFSLGILIYELAAGRRPFQGDTNADLTSAILKETPEALTRVKPDLPRQLGHIVERCLKKDPGERYPSANELRDELTAIQLTTVSGISAAPASVASTIRRPGVLVPLVVVVLALAAGAVWWGQREQKARWARNEALPAIQKILDDKAGDASDANWEAFQLDRQASRHIPDDPRWVQLRRSYSHLLTVHSQPAGARVFARPYAVPDAPWEELGTTPIDTLRFMAGILQLKLEKDGFETAEDIVWNRYFNTDGAGYALRPTGSIPGDMVFVSDEGPQLSIAAAPAGVHLPGIENLPAQAMGDFLIDRYEVSNRKFQEFVDAGAYEDPGFWKEPFVDGETELTFDEAMARFTDRTGRPGPATWEVGTFPEGRGDDPVSGISWFEAMAYAEFAGRSLPSIYHWDRVALTWASSEIVPFSNLAGSGVWPTGGDRARNRYGAFDLGGNVREWCINPDDRGRRFILGGAWNDPPYAFNDAYAQSPWDRSETNGVRCIQNVESSAKNDALDDRIELPFRDFAAEPRVSEETFGLYLSQFRYDPAPLNAEVIETLEDEYYTREKITFDAAYGGETMMAYLFLPKNAEPPFQTVVYFPGSGAIHSRSSEDLAPARGDFVLKSGRAFLYPIYKSTYERGDGLASDYPDETNNWKEHVVMWGKDLKRSVDYLESRQDIDSEKLAFMGVSWGAAMGPIMMAIEPRIDAGIVVVAGLLFQKSLPEVDALHYLPRVTVPMLILNGKYDFFFPYETSQVPYFELLGTRDEEKKLVVHEAGHSFPRTETARESIEWLDRYLGEVR